MALKIKSPRHQTNIVEDKSMQIMSPAFKHGEEIPQAYTYLGGNVNPPLIISNIPKWAQTLILLIQDLDAPIPFINWLVTDIDPTTYYIHEGTTPGKVLLNSACEHSYYGPTPIQGTHQYKFTLFAIGNKVLLPDKLSIRELYRLIDRYMYEETELIGQVCCGKITAIE